MRSRCGPAGRGPCPTALAVRSTPPLIALVTRATDAHWLAIVPGRQAARDQGPDDAPAGRVRHQAQADGYDVAEWLSGAKIATDCRVFSSGDGLAIKNPIRRMNGF